MENHHFIFFTVSDFLMWMTPDFGVISWNICLYFKGKFTKSSDPLLMSWQVTKYKIQKANAVTSVCFQWLIISVVMSVNKFILGWEWTANKQCPSSPNVVPLQHQLAFWVLGRTYFPSPFLQMVIKSLIVKGRRDCGAGRGKTGKQIFNYGPLN